MCLPTVLCFFSASTAVITQLPRSPQPNTRCLMNMLDVMHLSSWLLHSIYMGKVHQLSLILQFIFQRCNSDHNVLTIHEVHGHFEHSPLCQQIKTTFHDACLPLHLSLRGLNIPIPSPFASVLASEPFRLLNHFLRVNWHRRDASAEPQPLHVTPTVQLAPFV